MKAHFVTVAFLTIFAAVSASASVEVARVNDKVITQEYLDKRFQEANQANPSAFNSKKDFLEEIIRREVGIQEAKKQGVDKDPYVQEQVNTLLYQALLDKQLAQKVESIRVTDEEARSFFEKNPEIRTSHIFIGIKPGATKEEKQAAMARMKEIQSKQLKDSKMSFSEVAQRFSESPAAPMGGDIDYQTRDRIDPAYYDAALRLRTPGKTTDIVETPAGLFIVKLTGVRTWAEADRPKFKGLVFEQKRQKVLKDYLGALRSKAKVTVNNNAIR